jgi:type IV pilus assembly protein PilM
LPLAATTRDRILKFDAVQRILRWVDAMPRPAVAIEISGAQISAVRWSRTGTVQSFAMESLAAGMIVPSAVATNIVDAPGVRAALSRACSRIQATQEQVAVLLPDPVIRIFVEHFDEFPRSSAEAIPLLRWKLKKRVPFEMEDTVLSYVRQPSPDGGLDVVTTLARLRVLREYEELVESAGLNAGVISGSSLTALALLEGQRPTLMARVSNRSLATAILRDGALRGYRCTDLPDSAATVSPQVLLDEIFPLAAYFHDSWQMRIESVRLSGIGDRFPEFAALIAKEFQCKVEPLLQARSSDLCVSQGGGALAEAGLDGLVGWMHSHE